MRTTIDLPDDLHRVARELAHRDGRTLSEIVADLMRQALRPRPGHNIQITESGLPLVSVGRPITEHDVRLLEDDW